MPKSDGKCKQDAMIGPKEGGLSPKRKYLKWMSFRDWVWGLGVHRAGNSEEI